jgi:hypothetical protein
LREERKKLEDKRQNSYFFVKINDDLILTQSCGNVPRKKGGKWRESRGLGGNSYVDLSDNANR